ncbi:hypothetical protein ACTXT7_005274 [Hymenolepis weldensis]
MRGLDNGYKSMGIEPLAERSDIRYLEVQNWAILRFGAYVFSYCLDEAFNIVETNLLMDSSKRRGTEEMRAKRRIRIRDEFEIQIIIIIVHIILVEITITAHLNYAMKPKCMKYTNKEREIVNFTDRILSQLCFLSLFADAHFLVLPLFIPSRFEVPEDYDQFFTPSERSLVVDFILKRTGICGLVPSSWAAGEGEDAVAGHQIMTENEVNFENETRAKLDDVKFANRGKVDLGIDHMISEKIFLTAFPLHEPSHELLELLKIREESTPPTSSAQTYAVENNMRTLLTNQWGSLKMMLKYQPLDYIRVAKPRLCK